MGVRKATTEAMATVTTKGSGGRPIAGLKPKPQTQKVPLLTASDMNWVITATAAKSPGKISLSGHPPTKCSQLAIRLAGQYLTAHNESERCLFGFDLQKLI